MSVGVPQILGDLLSHAERINADAAQLGAGAPRIERNLHQLISLGQQLAEKTSTQSPAQGDPRIALLLGSRGYDLSGAAQHLKSLNSLSAAEPSELAPDLDIKSYLRSQRENAVLSLIENTKKKVYESAQTHNWTQTLSSWQKDKADILKTISAHVPDDMNTSYEPEIRPVHFTSGPSSRSTMNAVEVGYAKQVYTHNSAILDGRESSMLELITASLGSLSDKVLSDTWTCFSTMVRNLKRIDGDAMLSRTSPEAQQSSIRAALTWLESRHLSFLKELVHGQPLQAQVGGSPGMLNLVKAYLRIRSPVGLPNLEDGSIQGAPIWPVIFLCLRSAGFEAAMEAAEALPPSHQDFKSYLREFCTSTTRRLKEASEQALSISYNKVIKYSKDPYKKLVYCLLACTDFGGNHRSVLTKTEDYLWFKLHQVVPAGKSMEASSRMSFLDFQLQIVEQYGESYFRAHQQPLFYSQILFLLSSFEVAIEFLFRMDTLRPHAVHFALVLADLGLLLISPSAEAPLLSSVNQVPGSAKYLNLYRLLVSYTHKFQLTDPREVLEYLYHLRNLKSSSGESLYASAVVDLVLESREFETAIGWMDGDGVRKPGAVDRFSVEVDTIIDRVATECEKRGLLEDAAHMYAMAKNHGKTFSVMNRLLSQIVPLGSGAHPSRDRALELGKSLATMFQKGGRSGNHAQASTFYLLLDLAYFFDLFNSGDYVAAMEVIQKLQLFPTDLQSVEQKVARFNQFASELRYCISDAILALMTILFSLYQSTVGSEGSRTQSPLFGKIISPSTDSSLNHIRTQAKSLVTFGALLPYLLSGDVCTRLVQLEMMMV